MIMVTKNEYRTTTKQNAQVEQVKMNLPVRLMMIGGAVKASDNSAFNFASKNVASDYKNDLPVKKFQISNGAKTIVSAIASQLTNTIQSLDIFCHGDHDGIYFIIGSSLEKNVENYIKKQLASNLYASKSRSLIMGFYDNGNKIKNQYAISDLNLKAFTNESKVEIHGCNTGSGENCFASEFSKQLYKVGKIKSVVIGHASKANPNIDGTTSIKEQDYRHGIRIIFHNGKAIKKVTSSGRISADIIRSALGN